MITDPNNIHDIPIAMGIIDYTLPLNLIRRDSMRRQVRQMAIQCPQSGVDGNVNNYVEPPAADKHRGWLSDNDKIRLDIFDRFNRRLEEIILIAQRDQDDAALRGVLVYLAPAIWRLSEQEIPAACSWTHACVFFDPNQQRPGWIMQTGRGDSVFTALNHLLGQMQRDKPWWDWIYEKALVDPKTQEAVAKKYGSEIKGESHES